MSKRYYKPQSSAESPLDGGSLLPTQRPVAVYYRQSTDAQIGNISTSLQTVDMVEYLKARGWQEQDIIMIDMDAGVSGMTKIDERPGMRLLFELISAGEIGTVACQDEDRLFRDVTQIQVNIFIEACRMSQVLVITPTMLYDFANELTGTFHARQFRFKSEMAAEYISSVIRGKLHRARRRIMMEGRWAGTVMPPGFMVDIRKSIAGINNENWRRFAEFGPYAEVVNEYFRLFLSYSGNVLATLKHIHEHGPYYPDPKTCLPPEGFKVYYRLHQHGGGFCPERTGLTGMLTNALYIGHWVVKDTIVRWDNHPAIVSPEIFFRAYNYLSSTTLDGQLNQSYRPFKEQSRPSLEIERPIERPLCAGMIVAEVNSEKRSVGTIWIKETQNYVYSLTTPRPDEQRLWIKAAKYVDDAVTTLVQEKLKATFNSQIWEEALISQKDELQAEKRLIVSQLTALERVMENQIASLDALTNPEMIRGMEVRYEHAKAEHVRLSVNLASIEQEASQLQGIETLKQHWSLALENWGSLTREEIRAIFTSLVDYIEAEKIGERLLRFAVFWLDGTSDEFTLPKQMDNGWREWLPSESDTLLELIQSGASQVEIAQNFPERTWKMINNKIARLVGTGRVRFSPHPIRYWETFEMYRKRVIGDETPYQAKSGDHWTPAEDTELQDLLERGAHQVEIAAALPHRKWGRIRARITALKGKSTRVPGIGALSRDETYNDYRSRTEKAPAEEEVEQDEVSNHAHP